MAALSSFGSILPVPFVSNKSKACLISSTSSLDNPGRSTFFDLFDTNGTGKIDPKELKAAMQSLGFDSKNPTIYTLIADLDTPEAAKNGGVNFDDFVGSINNKLGDKESKEGIHRIFELFIDDPNADTITLSSLKKISKELGENMSDEELKDMLERASKNGVELTFEEFYDIMTKKSFP